MISERRLTYIVTLTKEGTNPVSVSVRGDYEIDCGDCGQTTSKSKDISLTATQKTQLISFGKNVVLADIEAEIIPMVQ